MYDFNIWDDNTKNNVKWKKPEMMWNTTLKLTFDYDPSPQRLLWF